MRLWISVLGPKLIFVTDLVKFVTAVATLAGPVWVVQTFISGPILIVKCPPPGGCHICTPTQRRNNQRRRDADAGGRDAAGAGRGRLRRQVGGRLLPRPHLQDGPARQEEDEVLITFSCLL